MNLLDDDVPLNIGYEPLPDGVLPLNCFRPGKENIPELKYWNSPITRLAAHMCIAAHFEHAIHEIKKVTPCGKRTKDWKLAGGLDAVLARLMVPDVKMAQVRRCVNGQGIKVYHLIETLNALYRVLEPNRDGPKRERRGGRTAAPGTKSRPAKYKYPKYIRWFPL